MMEEKSMIGVWPRGASWWRGEDSAVDIVAGWGATTAFAAGVPEEEAAGPWEP